MKKKKKKGPVYEYIPKGGKHCSNAKGLQWFDLILLLSYCQTVGTHRCFHCSTVEPSIYIHIPGHVVKDPRLTRWTLEALWTRVWPISEFRTWQMTNDILDEREDKPDTMTSRNIIGNGDKVDPSKKKKKRPDCFGSFAEAVPGVYIPHWIIELWCTGTDSVIDRQAKRLRALRLITDKRSLRFDQAAA